MIEETKIVNREPIHGEQRMLLVEQLFSINFPFLIEPMVCSIARKLAREYDGGLWNFYLLSNSGFYIAPESEKGFSVICDNHWQGELSADALGIATCLATYSYLSHSSNERFANICAQHYHLLRDYLCQHPEVAAILGAID